MGAGGAAAGPTVTGPTESKLLATIRAQPSQSMTTDGFRYVSFVPNGGHALRIFDIRRRSFLDLPACGPAAGYDGVFLLYCDADRGYPPQAVIDAGTGTISPIRGAQPNDRFYEIGRYWVGGEVIDTSGSPKPYEEFVWVNRSTGKRRTCAPKDQGFHECYDRNVNEPDLKTEVQVPLEHPYFVGVSRSSTLTLFRVKGGRHVASLSRRGNCNSACDVSLRNRLVTWTEPLRVQTEPSAGSHGTGAADVRGYVIKRRLRATWRVRGFYYEPRVSFSGGTILAQAHTRTRVIIQVVDEVGPRSPGSSEFQAKTYRLYEAPWPKR
jgi:hypothetical protein